MIVAETLLETMESVMKVCILDMKIIVHVQKKTKKMRRIAKNIISTMQAIIITKMMTTIHPWQNQRILTIGRED